MSVLADRIRGIVKMPVAPGVPAGTGTPPANGARDLSALGGALRDGCFVVERRFAPETRHGREAIGTFGECLNDAASAAPLFAAGAREPFVFFDLETTGLSGGAGTLAFLAGLGSFQPDGGFTTRQFLLTSHADERAMLERVHGELGAGAIVSFNGKSFDVPLLESRFAFHRLRRSVAELPHLDALHPARQFWALSTPGAPAPRWSTPGVRPGATDCSLGALERRLLGVRRVGDIDGFEAPARYFQFVRTGDARPLEAVLEHNRLDLLTLAALTARLLHVARHGPEAARSAREAIALGRLYARAGDDPRVRYAFTRGVELAGLADDPPTLVDALRGLAVALRRTRDYDDAAACWRQLLDIENCPRAIACEAAEALAIHHEHRARDFAAAKAYALKSLESLQTPSWTDGVRYRVARIERKLSARLL